MERVSDFDLENLIFWSQRRSEKEGPKSLHWFTENHKALVELREHRAADRDRLAKLNAELEKALLHRGR